MTLKLTYRSTTSVPVELEGITPDRLRNKSVGEIERAEVFCGNRKIPLAELFTVQGDPGEGQWEVYGDVSGVHWLGAHMSEGEIHIRGPAGRHVGSQMRGGRIVVHGDAGDWVGGEMRGGTIHVTGSAGHLAGAAYRGSRRGMRGGQILIQGDAGNEIGHTMRRGWIAIGGQAGDMVGFNMIAGTVFVFGDCAIRAGAGMRRGTLGLFGATRPRLLPTFRYACTYVPPILPLMFRRLAQWNFAFDPELLDQEFELHQGDMVEKGRGEIFVRRVVKQQ